MSSREKSLIAAGVVIILGFVIYAVYEPIQKAFSAQGARFEETIHTMDNVSIALARYAKLRARRQTIEDLYKEVEISEGVRSLLANIVESKAGIPAGQYDIDGRDAREFGTGYEQTPFRLRFIITDYKRLVSFLNEIVNGPKPLILTGLDIKKRQTADGSLEVELDVSSIRRVSK